MLWKPWDRRLMRAFLMYERNLCNDCGQDRRRSMNPDMDGEYEVKTIVCKSCASLENRRSAQNREKGAKDFVIDAGPPTEQLLPFVIDLTPSDDKTEGGD